MADQDVIYVYVYKYYIGKHLPRIASTPLRLPSAEFLEFWSVSSDTQIIKWLDLSSEHAARLMPNILVYSSVNNFGHDNLAVEKASQTVYVVSIDLHENEPKSNRHDDASYTAECNTLVI